MGKNYLLADCNRTYKTIEEKPETRMRDGQSNSGHKPWKEISLTKNS
jgi:hypothetical protein